MFRPSGLSTDTRAKDRPQLTTTDETESQRVHNGLTFILCISPRIFSNNSNRTTLYAISRGVRARTTGRRQLTSYSQICRQGSVRLSSLSSCFFRLEVARFKLQKGLSLTIPVDRSLSSFFQGPSVCLFLSLLFVLQRLLRRGDR